MTKDQRNTFYASLAVYLGYGKEDSRLQHFLAWAQPTYGQSPEEDRWFEWCMDRLTWSQHHESDLGQLLPHYPKAPNFIIINNLHEVFEKNVSRFLKGDPSEGPRYINTLLAALKPLQEDSHESLSIWANALATRLDTIDKLLGSK